MSTGTVTVSGTDGSGNASKWNNSSSLDVGFRGMGVLTIDTGGEVSRDTVIEQLLVDEPFTLEEYVHARAIAGTPEACINEVQRWIDAIAPDEFSLIFGGSEDQARLSQAVELFAREVMPAFK